MLQVALDFGSNVLQAKVFRDVLEERDRQDDRFGEQNHQDGTDEDYYFLQLQVARKDYDLGIQMSGSPYWADILREEVFEALCEEHDEKKLRNELVQVAAVALAWIEAIDRRASDQPETDNK